jgi:hypothetical protein
MLRLKTGGLAKILFLLKWGLMLGWEARYAQKFDHALVVSALEGELLRSANPHLTISRRRPGILCSLSARWATRPI